MTVTVTVCDHHDKEHLVGIPEGYFRVLNNDPQVGDCYLDVNELTYGDIAIWRDYQPDLPHFEPHLFACLIRKIPGKDGGQ